MSAAAATPALSLRIWGARGSIPTPNIENLRFGGNTPCVELRLNSDSFIFDCGTGVRALGLELDAAATGPLNLNVFLTHFHWDHLQGLPFFSPLYNPKNCVTFHSALPAEQLREVLSGQMVYPYFPVQFEVLEGSMNFAQITSTPTAFGPVSISTFALNHPQGAHGYRITAHNSTILYATDHEHGDADADARLLAAARNADILICDTQYTPAEYAHYKGWGHSTWLEATRLAAAANVKKLVLFHHDPTHDDETMQQIVNEARTHFPNTFAAEEGATFDLA